MSRPGARQLECPFVEAQASAGFQRARIGERARLLKEADRQAHDGPFRPDWESLKHYEQPQWYKDAKFGIFIHWGVYSVPGFGSEWYPRLMYQQKEKVYENHIKTFGPQDKFGYKDFIPDFKRDSCILTGDSEAAARVLDEEHGRG